MWKKQLRDNSSALVTIKESLKVWDQDSTTNGGSPGSWCHKRSKEEWTVATTTNKNFYSLPNWHKWICSDANRWLGLHLIGKMEWMQARCFQGMDVSSTWTMEVQLCLTYKFAQWPFVVLQQKMFLLRPKNHFFLPTTSIKETSLCEINDDFLNHLFLIHRSFMFVKPSSERREAVMSSQPAGETVLHIFSRPVSLTENLHTHKVNHEVSNLWRIC